MYYQNYLFIDLVINYNSMQQPTSTQFSDHQDSKKKVAQANNPNLVDQTHIGSKINQNFIERTRWTILLLVFYVIAIAMGQFVCFLAILILIYQVFKEINSLKRNYQKQSNIPMTKFINWYFFGVANYYCLGRFILETFPDLVIKNKILFDVLTSHQFICFCLFIIGFVAFVLSLKQGFLKYQFRIFAWILLATIMIVFQSWLIIANLFKGMIWFVLPTVLIVCNDIFAYLVGYFFGSHQLIAISPKKTWQGYLGGAFFTFIFSYIFTTALVTIPGFTCPMNRIEFTPFSYPTCDDSHLTRQIYSFSFIPINFMVIHIHVFVLSLFASTVGPFGGFFASGLKRSIKIKDFSNVIPGHGGFSDRFDCQTIMASFTYFYLSTFATPSKFNSLFWLNLFTPNEQFLLLNQLKNKFLRDQV